MKEKFGVVILAFMASFIGTAWGDGIPLCDLERDPWQVSRGVSEREVEYVLDTSSNIWDFDRNVKILKGGGVVLCNLVLEDGVSVVLPNGFNPMEKNREVPLGERAWLKGKKGESFPIMGGFIPDITRTEQSNILRFVQEENVTTINLGGQRAIVNIDSNVDVAPPVQPTQWEPVLAFTTKEDSDFRKSVRKVVDGKDREEECHAWCYVAKGITIVGVGYLTYEVLKQVFGHNKTSTTSPPAPAGPQGPTSPAGFVVISGQM